MRTSVLYPALAVALVVGAACKGPDSSDTAFTNFQLVASGSHVIPSTAADTTAEVTGTVTGTLASGNVTVSYSVVKLPAGAATIDSVFLYTIGPSVANYTVGGTGNTTYVAPSARLCGSTIGVLATGQVASTPPACSATSLSSVIAQPTTVLNANQTTTTNTATSLTTSMRNYGQQMVFFTSGSFFKRGAIRGTPFVVNP